MRRNRSTGEVAFYHTWTPAPVRLARLVTVAGTPVADRRRLPDRERAAALDQHQVRTWTSWHRWTTLALLAHAFLSVIAATAQHHARPAPDYFSGRSDRTDAMTSRIAPLAAAAWGPAAASSEQIMRSAPMTMPATPDHHGVFVEKHWRAVPGFRRERMRRIRAADLAAACGLDPPGIRNSGPD
jgi:hypothetical protein